MRLNYYITEDYTDLSTVSAKIIIDHINADPTGLYCFAGGDTPVKTLNLLAEATQKGQVDLSQAAFIELDEWVSLDPANPGSCASYLKTNLFEPAGIKKEQIHVFDPLAVDLAAECQKANDYIQQHGGLSLCLLGVGVNGHLGFNEPGVSFDNNAHVIQLDESTQEVGKKYFTDDKVDRTQGITLGIKQLLAAKSFIVQASGNRKKEAIKHVLQGEITNEYPVTAMWHHSDPTLIVDKAVIQ